LLAAAHLHDVLGRDEHFADVVLQPVRLDALLQRLGDLLLEPRVRVDDVPALRRDVRHAVGPVTPKIRKIHCTNFSSPKSTTNSHTQKNPDTKMTTPVVAYPSLELGPGTRFSSSRPALRNTRAP